MKVRPASSTGSGSYGDPIDIHYTKLRLETEEPREPSQPYGHDAGFDLTCTRGEQIGPNLKVQVATGLQVDLPAHVFGLVVPRSSTFYRKGLTVHHGVIDPGYRGEVMILVHNPTNRTVFINEGDRIAQLLVLPKLDVHFIQVGADEMTPGDRGTAGFGSSGGLMPGEDRP